MRIGNCGPSGVIVMMTTLIALLLGCSKKAAPDQEPKSQHAGPFVIYTVNYPLSYFAQRMAPVGARVVFPVPPGIDPAFWKPTADAVQGFQSASLILLNGAGYARWTRYTTLPRTRIVAMSCFARTRLGRAHCLSGERSRSAAIATSIAATA